MLAHLAIGSTWKELSSRWRCSPPCNGNCNQQFIFLMNLFLCLQGIMYSVSLYYIFWCLFLESGLLVQFPCSTTLVCPFKCIYHSHHRWNMRMCTFVDSSHQDEPLSSLVCWTACISFLVAFDFEFTNNQQKLHFNVSLLLFETGIISVFLLCNHRDLLCVGFFSRNLSER